MNPTPVLLKQRQPLIRFLGKRTFPKKHDVEPPKPHPAAPTSSLPTSFADYRQKATQHGPLKTQPPQPSAQRSSHSSPSQSSSPPRRVISGGRTGHSLGSVQPEKGQYFDRSELPRRFQRTAWTEEEIEAINSGGSLD